MIESFFKSLRSHKKVGSRFPYYFCLISEASGAGSVTRTNRSGSGRPKKTWILRIRIRNTGKRYLILEQLDLLKGVEGVSLPLRVAIDHQLAH
jgi:hypothetical protein